MVILGTSDSRTIDIKPEYIKISSLLSEMISMNREDLVSNDNIIPIPYEYDIIKRIVSFCTRYNKEPIKVYNLCVTSNDIRNYVPDWYANFVDIPIPTIFKLVDASNFLMIDPLLDLVCLKVACIMSNKTSEELKFIFDIEDDFTTEEKQSFIKAHEWVYHTL